MDREQPKVLSASSLIGDQVYNWENEKLGHIEEIMVDLTRGTVAYAVLSFGGLMGVGEKLFAVPWSALSVDTDNECLVFDVPKEKLESAQGFSKDDWPDFANETWARQVHDLYGKQPYWEVGGVQQGPVSPMMGRHHMAAGEEGTTPRDPESLH